MMLGSSQLVGNSRIGPQIQIRSSHRVSSTSAPVPGQLPSKRTSTVPLAKDDNAPDLIESLVGKLFGKKALEDRAPAGMQRLDVPEMWPATTDEFAAPVQGDTPDIAVIRPLLKNTQLEKAPLRLAYDAAVHGWSARSFHDQVNTFGAGLIVLKTKGGAVIGGYNPRGWIGLGEDRDSIAAFLFTWPDGNTSARPIKLPKAGGPSLAVVDKPDAGIAFGAEGLKLLVPGRERQARCRLGTFYEKLPGGGRSLFAASEDPKVAEVESIKCYVAEGSGEEWELDGIVWKTKMK